MNRQGVIVPTRQLQVWVKQDERWKVATSQATYVAIAQMFPRTIRGRAGWFASLEAAQSMVPGT
jgi:hypothetical protein